MWLPRLLGSPRAPMTLPRASRPLLIWMLSLSRSPVFPVRSTRSEPARSTKWNLEVRMWRLAGRGPPPRRWSTCRVKTVWERLERGFIAVAPVWRAVFPDSSRLSTSSRPSTSHSFTPHSTAHTYADADTDTHADTRTRIRTHPQIHTQESTQTNKQCL
uniref:Uncharacterized protein n=1 Tax=Gadus morhua TaxID=8049 RepID=A0A8C5BPN5_GADMO